MKIAYFDCFSGISGDMILGALVDAGLSLEQLRSALSRLPVKGYTLKARTVHKAEIRGTKLDVVTDSASGAYSKLKNPAEMEKIVQRSRFSEAAREKGIRVLRRITQSEAKVHGVPASRIRVHEMDPLDTLVDIMGTVAGLDLLGVEEVLSSPLRVGRGIKGLAPATAEMLRGAPIYSSDTPYELTTPTGAALLTTLAADFGPAPMMTLDAVGYGAGTLDLSPEANLLRVLIGTRSATGPAYQADRVIHLETNIDDLSPQIYEHLMERLLESGALDVYFTPIVMKKGRPATKVSVLAPHLKEQALLALLFGETTTLGARISEVTRVKLSRTEKEVSTRFGKVRVKITQRQHGKFDAIPEYHDCKQIAQKTGLPLRTVLEEVRTAALRKERGS